MLDEFVQDRCPCGVVEGEADRFLVAVYLCGEEKSG